MAKFCCERVKKVPATVKLSTNTATERKEYKIAAKGEKIIKKEEIKEEPQQELKKKIP